MPEWIHLKAPNGTVIAMTLPLHVTIEQQWQRGELQQVNADGTPWTGVLEAVEPEAPPADDSDGESSDGLELPLDSPVRPKDSAHKAAWQAHAVALGVCTEEEAAGATRAQLIEITTPPELLPLDPEV